MAIKTTVDDEKITFELTRGHYNAIKEITERMSFKDHECSFLYMLALMSSASIPKVTICNRQFEKETIIPNKELLRG